MGRSVRTWYFDPDEARQAPCRGRGVPCRLIGVKRICWLPWTFYDFRCRVGDAAQKVEHHEAFPRTLRALATKLGYTQAMTLLTQTSKKKTDKNDDLGRAKG
jgi:hypothetical protein